MRSSQNDTATNLDAVVNYTISLKPAYEIVELRESSNAKAAGLMIGDISPPLMVKLHICLVCKISMRFFTIEKENVYH